MDFWDEANLAVGRMLMADGHATLGDWALAFGYTYEDDWDQWFDDDGYAVDIESKAIDSAHDGGYFGKDNK